MEELYKCEYQSTQEMYNEFTWRIFTKWKFLILPVVLLVDGLIFVFMMDETLWGLMCIVAGIIWPMYSLLGLKRKMKNALKDNQAANKGKLPYVNVDFSEKDISHKESRYMESSIYDYQQVTKLMESKNLFILMFPFKEAIFIPKDSFTKGTYEEFKHFINKKCFNHKGIQFKMKLKK